MVNAEFFDALEQLEKEKGIPVDYMLDRVGQALITAYKRDNDGMTDSHQPIYNGTIPWNDVFDAISEMPSPPDLTVEYNPKYADDIMAAVGTIRNELPHKAK